MKRRSSKRISLKDLSPLLINLWRLTFFSVISFTFGFLIFKNGWEEIDTSQIHIEGNSYLDKDLIIQGMGINLPSPLLAINPKQIEENLLKKLPIKATKSGRIITPPTIYIQILERKPIAFATRTTVNGIEQGMLDAEAHWIPIYDQIQAKKILNKQSMHIQGWSENQKELISYIINNQEKLSSPLEKIILSPNGDISFKTRDFEFIYLGSNHSLLKKQISTLSHLMKALPSQFKNKKTTIDLKDPSNPKLLLE